MRRFGFILWFSTLLILLLPVVAGAQQKTRQRRAPSTSQQEAQAFEREQRRLDEEAVQRMEDPGFDFAIITAKEVNIRETPSLTGQVLYRAKRADMLALIDREPEGTWYHVIHVESAVEGWVEESVIVKRYTLKSQSGPKLEAERVGTYEDPDIEISNDSYKDLTLNVGTVKYVIPANQKRTVTLKAGNHRYYGYAPGVRPSFGQKLFEAGYRYTWKFWIERH